MIGAQVAAEAESWIGTPFLWQHRAKGHGCDCKGLIAGVARAVGYPENPELNAGDYSTKVDTRRLKSGLALMFDPVAVADRQPGDVLLLRMGGAAQHLAIYAPTAARPDRVIEAMPSGPAKVRPATWAAHHIDSVWRWREYSQ